MQAARSCQAAGCWCYRGATRRAQEVQKRNFLISRSATQPGKVSVVVISPHTVTRPATATPGCAGAEPDGARPGLAEDAHRVNVALQ
jgi:hypothetical protein